MSGLPGPWMEEEVAPPASTAAHLAKHLYVRAVVADAQNKPVTLSPAFAREVAFRLLHER